MTMKHNEYQLRDLAELLAPHTAKSKKDAPRELGARFTTITHSNSASTDDTKQSTPAKVATTSLDDAHYMDAPIHGNLLATNAARI